MDWVTQPEAWIALITLTALELVLGIDNIVFISIVVGKLPEHQRSFGYRLGLGMAMVMRILLLLAISWIMGLTQPLFSVLGHSVSGRDLVLIFGGLFLVAKATFEIHDDLEGREKKTRSVGKTASFAAVGLWLFVWGIIWSLVSAGVYISRVITLKREEAEDAG